MSSGRPVSRPATMIAAKPSHADAPAHRTGPNGDHPMISSRTKKQLVVFVFITLVGISYVGARYARLDRLVYDSAYQVHAQFAQSGGIFTGAEVSYRGVKIGQVS